MKIPAIWEKTYYEPVFFDNSRRLRDQKETGDWSGILLTRHYEIKRYSNGLRIIVSPAEAINFGGKNEEEMIQALEKVVEGKGELPENTDRDFVPQEVKDKFNELKTL